MLPDATILLDYMHHLGERLAREMTVDVERMRANLDLTRGQIMAEAVMMALGRSLGHEEAHALVLAASRRALAGGRDLVDVLAEEPAVAGRLTRSELEALLDPTTYLGLSASSARAVAERTSRVQP